MQEQWRIRVTGKRRKEVSVDLLVQAVMAYAEQLRDEQRRAEEEAAKARTMEPCRPQKEATS